MFNVKLILTKDQERVFEGFKEFLKDSDSKVFILQGYAGTGKTTLMKFFIEHMRNMEINHRLLASTGRAAKVLSNSTDALASTVHSMIYKFEDFNHNLDDFVDYEDRYGKDKDGQLLLQFVMTPLDINETYSQNVYLIDEASMISDVKDLNANQAEFGSGRLLKDLFDYDANGKFIFVGDESQLPPVHQDISPALSKRYLKEVFDIDAKEMTLTQIVRQQADNSIIHASHRIRALYQNPPNVKWGMLPLAGYKDIKVMPDEIMMINKYINLIKDDYSKATFISYSNNKCNSLNNLIRQSLRKRSRVEVGDLLLVTQNNSIGLLNGDMVVVEQIKPENYKVANINFLMVEVRELVTGKMYSLLMIETLLYSGRINLSQAQQKVLFIDFYKRMRKKGINQKHPLFKDALANDPYLNALRTVYGYAITCYKAQGGEWDDVFVNFRRSITLEADASAYQWVYTALTRARERVHVVDDFFISE